MNVLNDVKAAASFSVFFVLQLVAEKKTPKTVEATDFKNVI